MNHYFEDNDPEIQPAQRSKFFSETNLKLFGGALTVIGGSLSFLGQHPKGYWVFVALAAVIFIWIFVPPVISLVRRFLHWRSNKRYVTSEFPRLKKFYTQLLVFVSRDDTRGFLNLVAVDNRRAVCWFLRCLLLWLCLFHLSDLQCQLLIGNYARQRKFQPDQKSTVFFNSLEFFLGTGRW
jgi:hypothetical protein